MNKSKIIALAMMGMMMSVNAQSNETRPKEFEPPKEPKKGLSISVQYSTFLIL